MFAGHLGAGLILKRVNPSVNLGALFLAVLLLDMILWVFILLGIESVQVPSDFRHRHYLTFYFPYSHGLTSSLFWSTLTGLICYRLLRNLTTGRSKAAFFFALAVFSHFILDLLVHISEMPIFGPGSYALGFGLWNHMHLALGLEAFIALAGTYFWLRRSELNQSRKVALALLMALVTGMTIVGQSLQKSAPKPHVVAVSSLATIFLLILAGFWLDQELVRS